MKEALLSYTQITAWLTCRKKWAYSYLHGLKPPGKAFPLLRGSLLHHGMEKRLTGRPYSEAVTAWEADVEVSALDYPELVAAADRITAEASTTFQEHYAILEDKEGLLLEREFIQDFPDWVPHFRGLRYIPDAVCVKKTEPFENCKFVVDFKSYSVPREENAGAFDLQGAIYQRGIQERGINVIGSSLFQLATNVPKEPRINADGSVNKADEKAAANWTAVTGDVRAYRSKEFLLRVWNHIVVPAACEIGSHFTFNNQTLDTIPKLDYFTCRFCEFNEPCLAGLKGHDESAILAEGYETRKERRR